MDSLSNNAPRFDNVNVGDKVIVSHFSTGWVSRKVVEVQHVTATRLKADGDLYRRDNGNPVGGFGNRMVAPYSERLAQEILDEGKRRDLVNHLTAQKWNHMPLEVLEATVDALNAAQLKRQSEREGG